MQVYVSPCTLHTIIRSIPIHIQPNGMDYYHENMVSKSVKSIRLENFINSKHTRKKLQILDLQQHSKVLNTWDFGWINVFEQKSKNYCAHLRKIGDPCSVLFFLFDIRFYCLTFYRNSSICHMTRPKKKRTKLRSNNLSR